MGAKKKLSVNIHKVIFCSKGPRLQEHTVSTGEVLPGRGIVLCLCNSDRRATRFLAQMKQLGHHSCKYKVNFGTRMILPS